VSFVLHISELFHIFTAALNSFMATKMTQTERNKCKHRPPIFADLFLGYVTAVIIVLMWQDNHYW
jgi:hypothetical protein